MTEAIGDSEALARGTIASGASTTSCHSPTFARRVWGGNGGK